MKKTTLAFIGILCTTLTFAQTYSTGTMEVYNDTDDGVLYTAKVDVTSSLVTLTLSGPDNRYLGFGFGVQSMTSGGDVVIFYDNTSTPEADFQLSDRTFVGVGSEPTVDANQDWTISSNTVDAGQRTLVATRVPDTGHDGDYVFETTDASLDFVWSIGFSYFIQYHGATRGASMQSFTLGQDELAFDDFKISPNPGRSKFELSLPSGVQNVTLDVFDVLGKKIITKKVSKLSSTIDVSKWNSGVYLVRITSDNGTQTKRFVKQ